MWKYGLRAHFGSVHFMKFMWPVVSEHEILNRPHGEAKININRTKESPGTYTTRNFWLEKSVKHL